MEDKGAVIGGREKRSEIVEWSGTVWRCLLRYIPLVAWRRADVNDSMKSGISRDRGSMMAAGVDVELCNEEGVVFGGKDP